MLNPIEKFKRSILHLNRSLHHWVLKWKHSSKYLKKRPILLSNKRKRIGHWKWPWPSCRINHLVWWLLWPYTAGRVKSDWISIHNPCLRLKNPSYDHVWWGPLGKPNLSRLHPWRPSLMGIITLPNSTPSGQAFSHLNQSILIPTRPSIFILTRQCIIKHPSNDTTYPVWWRSSI